MDSFNSGITYQVDGFALGFSVQAFSQKESPALRLAFLEAACSVIGSS